jgi:hypothetical protein
MCAQCFDDSLIEIAQRIDHTQEDQPGAALSKADAQMACFVHVVHRVCGTALQIAADVAKLPERLQKP